MLYLFNNIKRKDIFELLELSDNELLISKLIDFGISEGISGNLYKKFILYTLIYNENSFTRAIEKGLKVEALGVDGFVPMSEALVEKGNLSDFYAVGDTAKAIIVEIKQREWRLKLSIKKLKDEEERKSFEKHLTDKEESVTIGDAFKDVLEESK